jgi:hypothetical protein
MQTADGVGVPGNVGLVAFSLPGAAPAITIA